MNRQECCGPRREERVWVGGWRTSHLDVETDDGGQSLHGELFGGLLLRFAGAAVEPFLAF